MSIARLNTGKIGERKAVRYLKREGYRILEKNFKTKLGEIDIIGEDEGFISFVEIRSRNNPLPGPIEETITRKKKLHITRAALSYIKRYGLEDRDCRFDVLCIEDVESFSPKFKLIKNAFELDPRYR